MQKQAKLQNTPSNVEHLTNKNVPTFKESPNMRQQTLEAANSSSKKIAPLWPLKNFVAVNPFMGIANQNLGAAGLTVAQAAGARITMPRAYYAQKLAEQRIEDNDLAQAITELKGELPLGVTPSSVRTEALRSSTPHAQFQLATFASLATRATDTDWQTYLIDHISQWCASYFDEGIGGWNAQSGDNATSEDIWKSFKSSAIADRGAELLGLSGARSLFDALPNDPDALLCELAETLELEGEMLETYFHRLLGDVPGWAGFSRFKEWSRELAGEDYSGAQHLLTIRAAWELVLFRGIDNPQLKKDWLTSRAQYASDARNEWFNARGVDLVMQLAFERAEQRRIAALLAAKSGATASHNAPAPAGRPSVQAAFCIDVRSERYRRALETSDPNCETIGFAGFFGLSLSYVDSIGTTSARCPVLLQPAFEAIARQGHTSAPFGLTTSVKRIVAANWSRFQRSAVSNFGFVEAMGFSYLPKLLKNTFQPPAPLQRRAEERGADEPSNHGKTTREHEACGTTQGLLSDLGYDQQVDLAEGLLRGMSLVNNFAPLVLLVGHGSTTANNPYASALDCGACGGHAGDINAQFAAQILNTPQIRAALSERKLEIPIDTLFVAALHDTTTDNLKLFDVQKAPESHKEKLADLHTALVSASEQVRIERAFTFEEDVVGNPEALAGRALDWSQVRPEWGLAGCNLFIAAPRSRTQSVSLEGRSFLHNYSAETDPEYNVLETILTAPLVVASWIAMQYYGSTVDNAHFGSGDKTLHNVVSGIGVLEGASGDLRAGLPMQSLHNGKAYVHEPMRLTALIEAPVDAIDRIVNRHKGLKDLVTNQWIQLHAISSDGTVLRREPDADSKSSLWIPVLPETESAQRDAQAI